MQYDRHCRLVYNLIGIVGAPYILWKLLSEILLALMKEVVEGEPQFTLYLSSR